MNLLSLLLPLSLLLFSCSHRNKNAELSETAKGTPEWLYSPYSECSEAQELCATGEARSKADAEAQARANIASIFEVKVKSDLTVTNTASSSLPWISRMNEEIQHSVSNSVDEILENVEVKKTFKKDGLSYALASLDREKARDLIEPRLNKLDKESEILWENRKRTSLRRLIKLNLEREKLADRLSIITGHRIPPRVSFEDIIRWRESRPATVPLNLKVGQAPDWLTEKIKELLTESGFRLVNNESHRVVSLNVDSIKEYLNVSGFEKFTFTLNLASYDNGEKKRVISTSETVNGRTQADALLKIKHAFTEYLEQHLSDLHLD
jgi:hypothetical protein